MNFPKPAAKQQSQTGKLLLTLDNFLFLLPATKEGRCLSELQSNTTIFHMEAIVHKFIYELSRYARLLGGPHGHKEGTNSSLGSRWVDGL